MTTPKCLAFYPEAATAHRQRHIADLELSAHTSIAAGIIVPIYHLTYHTFNKPVLAPDMDVMVSATRTGTLLADNRALPPSCLEPPPLEK